MEGQKKYYLNVSSYKYKRECMKLFQSTLNKVLTTHNNDLYSMSENLCPGGKRCKNYSIILSLEQKIKALNDTVNQLTKINEYSESNHSRNNKTPTKMIEPKKQESFNEFCNSFRNSIKKKKLQENKRNLFGNITLPPQMSEPYKIRPYNSISNESKVPYKKIPNKRNIDLDLNHIKTYKTKLYLKTESNDVINYHNYKNLTLEKNSSNEPLILNIKDNNLKNNKEKDNGKSIENKKDEENNQIKKYETSLSPVLDEEEKKNSNNEDNNNIIINKKNDVNINTNNDEKNSSKKNNKKIEEENKNQTEQKNIKIKKISDEQMKSNNTINSYNNKKDIKKGNNNNLNLPFIKKINTYKIVEQLKNNKIPNQRYEYEIIDSKNYVKEDNKLYFRKSKGKIRNSFNAPKNKYLSRSFGFRYNTEGNESLGTKNIKTLTSQYRFNKKKINSLNNFKPLSLTQKPFKLKRNLNLASNMNLNYKWNSEGKLKNNKFNILLSPNNSFEFKEFIKDFEFKNEEGNNNKNIIFNEIYNLSCFKGDILIEKLKTLSKETIDKYFSFIKNSLKYLKDSIDLLSKFKIFHHLMNNSKNKTNNYSSKNKLLITEEFQKYKDDAINLLNCEDVHIFIYDAIFDCLISKGEKEELKYPKNKDLIGLSFTSAKIVRYEADNSSSVLTNENSINKINNLLIYPLKDKNDNIYGVIEAVNKKQDLKKNIHFIDYFTEKTSFNKSDEIMLSLVSKDLGNFCKYYNYIKYNNNYLLYYHSLCIFFQNLFIKKKIKEENNIFYLINEIIELSKIIFEMKDIQFILCKNEKLYDLQKNKFIPFEGIVYRCYKEKKIIYISNPLLNNNYSIKSDLIVNIYSMNKNDNLCTIPIFEMNTNNVIMIIQIKTNKELNISINNNNNLSVDKEKLSEENLFIIEHISFIIQKYLFDNIESIPHF